MSGGSPDRQPAVSRQTPTKSTALKQRCRKPTEIIVAVVSTAPSGQAADFAGDRTRQHRRPNVLGYPAPTTSRFLVLVFALLAAGLFAGGWTYNAFRGRQWAHELVKCSQRLADLPLLLIPLAADTVHGDHSVLLGSLWRFLVLAAVVVLTSRALLRSREQDPSLSPAARAALLRSVAVPQAQKLRDLVVSLRSASRHVTQTNGVAANALTAELQEYQALAAYYGNLDAIAYARAVFLRFRQVNLWTKRSQEVTELRKHPEPQPLAFSLANCIPPGGQPTTVAAPSGDCASLPLFSSAAAMTAPMRKMTPPALNAVV